MFLICRVQDDFHVIRKQPFLELHESVALSWVLPASHQGGRGRGGRSVGGIQLCKGAQERMSWIGRFLDRV